MTRPLDDTDRRILDVLRGSLRAAPAHIAREVGLSRGTVYSRLERLEREGVLIGFIPDIDATRAGFGVLAFTTLEIRQGSHSETTGALVQINEIVEIHTVTGSGDLLCRIIARSNDHLHEILQRVTALPTVTRSSSQLALATSHRRSIVDALLDG